MKKILLLAAIIVSHTLTAQNVGIGTTTPQARLHVTDSSVLFSATGDIPGTIGNPPISGNGRRIMWYAGKAAFRAGFVGGTNWDKDSIGLYSFSTGFDTKAKGSAATALGYGTTASGTAATALGIITTASGEYSTALGNSTIASGDASTALGSLTIASGFTSTALGSGTIASGNYSTALGNSTIASGHFSTALGLETTASGLISTALGYNSNAAAEYSMALGQYTTANSWNSISLGRYNDPIATSPTTTWVGTEPLLIIGNGTGPSAKSNALVILKNGNVGMGTNTPVISAKLDITSTSSGFLPPRMTTAQRDAIVGPVPGLMIFNSTTQTIDFYTLYGWSSIKAAIAGGNKLLGGHNNETTPCIQKTSDGGYILAGTSTSSANGDVTGISHDNPALGQPGDIWVVKLTATGIISWNKLLGGDVSELGYSIQQTIDGGYIVAGTSYSSANGNVTGVNHGGTDYWIVKLDGSGNIVWNKLLGGTGNEKAYSIQQTSDGGYIVAGESTSSANGDVTETNHGGGTPIDYWIVKLNATGAISWNRLLGGDGIEIARSVQEAAAGGFIVAGSSTSSANGNVTPANHGNTDYWIVKLDAAGAISWNRLLGGTFDEEAFSIRQNTTDGAYLIAGYSQSSANGDVTGTNHQSGSKEFWIVRLDVSGSTLLWNKLLGGTGYEEANSIITTTDGGYIVAGYSGSFADGDVTGVNHGGSIIQDFWIVKLDSFGNITWNKLLGGSGNDIAYSVQQTADGGYIVAGSSTSSSNGDVTPTNHRITPPTTDFWIIRLDANGNIL
ncbi:MAG: hypothetical protein ABIO79_02975 [Ferruginibacter sp.]